MFCCMCGRGWPQRSKFDGLYICESCWHKVKDVPYEHIIKEAQSETLEGFIDGLEFIKDDLEYKDTPDGEPPF